MRKLIVLSVVLWMGFSLCAVSLDLGLSYGGRSLADSDLKDVFGNGMVFCPELSVNLYKGLTLGILLESGYDKEGKLGDLFVYDSTLKVSGFEGFIGYTLDLGRVHPFVRLGYGSYQYKQTVDIPIMPEYQSFEKTLTALTFGGGLKVDLVGGLYVGGQLRYVPLKVTPVDHEIDLGGLRYLLTVGYRFDFNK